MNVDDSASHGAFFFCTFLVQLCLVVFVQISVLIGYKKYINVAQKQINDSVC